MLISKNIYNDLTNKEAFSFFKKQCFYLVEDNLSFIFNNFLYLQNSIFQKQLQKFIFKKIFASNFININLLKFPIYIVFITKFLFFDNLFVSFFLKNSNIIFLKYKNQIFNLVKIKSKTLFNLILKFKNLTYFNLHLNLNKIYIYNHIFSYRNIIIGDFFTPEPIIKIKMSI